MSCAMGVYKAFEEDHRENLEWLKSKGKCVVPSLILNGEMSQVGKHVEHMGPEVTHEGKMEIGTVSGGGHYIAEENPNGFVEVVTRFLAKH